MEKNNGILKQATLPETWMWTELYKVVSILDNDRIPVNAEEREERIKGKSKGSLFPYYGATGQVGWIDDFLFDDERVLLGEDGAPFLDTYKQKAYIINGKSWVNNHAHVLKAAEGISLNKYVMHYLNVFDYHGFVTGTTRYKLTQAQMRQIPFPLAPIPEQSRIVAKIEELFSQLDAAEAALKRARDNLKRYRQSVLQAAVSGELTREWRAAHAGQLEPAAALLERIRAERKAKWAEELRAKGKDPAKEKYVEPQAPDVSALPELPEGWEWICVRQMALHRLGKMLDKEKNQGIPRSYLRNANVRWFTFDLKELFLIRVTDEEFNEVSVEKGDLVICEGGEPGRAAVWEKGDKIIIQKALHRLRTCKSVSPYWVMFVLAANAGSGSLEKYFTGSTIKHFTGESLLTYVIPIPSVLEQEYLIAEIEKYFSVIEQLESNIDNGIAHVSRLRQSILQRAFSGKLI